MTMKPEIRKIIRKIFYCPLSSTKRCGDIKLETDSRKGIFPRGLHPNLKSKTNILVVAKNPGSIFSQEKRIYSKYPNNPWKCMQAYDKRQIGILFSSKNKLSSRFHINRFRYLKFIMSKDVKLETFEDTKERFEEWRKNNKKIQEIEGVSSTDLFKCSTKNEQQKFRNHDFYLCFFMFFMQELKILKPKVLLALGSEVNKFLKYITKEDYIKKGVEIIPIKHPSYFYKRKDENKRLKSIRSRIQKVLGK